MIFKVKNFIANTLLKSVSYAFQLLIFLLTVNIVALLIAFIFMTILINYLINYINQINGDLNVSIARASWQKDSNFPPE